jgi:hypothetical protein
MGRSTADPYALAVTRQNHLKLVQQLIGVVVRRWEKRHAATVMERQAQRWSAAPAGSEPPFP